MKIDGIILRVIGTFGVCRCALIVSAEFIHRDWTVALVTAGMTAASLAVLWTE
ncbi:hypothetical protein [Brucella tritici]|uniref:hypothetical protein n=1 Tax=Brucella tritici TaxID=94626 RepID=UPI00178C507B|nr:hypothetical protein [Brucella tritici]